MIREDFGLPVVSRQNIAVSGNAETKVELGIEDRDLHQFQTSGGDISLYENNRETEQEDYDQAELRTFTSQDLMCFSENMDVLLTDLLESKCFEPFNVLPDLTEYDGEHEFEVVPQKQNSNNYQYSVSLKKAYITVDKTFQIDLHYKQFNDELFVRVMMVFLDEISIPVYRCDNHIAKDKERFEENKKYSVARCENPNVKYCGEREGKNICNRLSILIPLGYVKPNDDNKAKQMIALRFKCQNSCIGRRQTAVIFTLENNKAEILGKKIINVKICSCPNRDKGKDEKKLEVDCPQGKRPMKRMRIKEERDEVSADVLPIKQEPSTSIPGLSFASNGDITLALKLPNLRVTRQIVQNSFNVVAGQMALDSENAKHYASYLRDLKKMKEFINNVNCDSSD